MRTSLRRSFAVVAALTAVVTIASPAWAEFPDQGNRILYVRARLGAAPMSQPARGGEFEVADLFSMKNNGKDARRLVDTPSTDEFGGWYSPDGEEVVFWGLKKDRVRVFRADADGKHVTALTTNQTSVMPNWSKNGKQVVYVKYPALAPTRAPWTSASARGVADSELMIMDADGDGKHSILAGDAIVSPGWSPTRAEIAFSMQTEAGGQIFLISPDGGVPEPVCCDSGDALFLDWSPDGRRLLFQMLPSPARRGDRIAQVMSIRRNGSDPTEITDRSFFPTLPRFSDDAERVVYTREDGETFDLFRTRSDGTGGNKRLTDTPNKVEFLNLLGG
jgi:Tol biopolymer transport system component